MHFRYIRKCDFPSDAVTGSICSVSFSILFDIPMDSCQCRVTISDQPKFCTQTLTLISLGSWVGWAVAFSKKAVTFADKLNICGFFYVADG